MHSRNIDQGVFDRGVDFEWADGGIFVRDWEYLWWDFWGELFIYILVIVLEKGMALIYGL